MSNRTVELVYNRTGQVVELYPAQAHLGIPSNVSAYVYDGTRSNDDTADFTPTVSVDSLSTTLSSASGQSQTVRNRLNVTSSSGFSPGRLVLVDNGSGQREVVEPIKVSTGVVDLTADLAYDYPTATTTIKGIRMTWTVDAGWVADEGNVITPDVPSYRVRWQYTIASTVYNFQTYLRLVRKTFSHNVTVHDVIRRCPEILAKEPAVQRGQQLRKLIEAAEDRFRVDLLAEGLRPESINDTEIIDELIRTLVLYFHAQNFGAPNNRDRELYVQEMRQEYGNLFGRTISTLKVPLDQGTEGATANRPIKPYVFAR